MNFLRRTGQQCLASLLEDKGSHAATLSQTLSHLVEIDHSLPILKRDAATLASIALEYEKDPDCSAGNFAQSRLLLSDIEDTALAIHHHFAHLKNEGVIGCTPELRAAHIDALERRKGILNQTFMDGCASYTEPAGSDEAASFGARLGALGSLSAELSGMEGASYPTVY